MNERPQRLGQLVPAGCVDMLRIPDHLFCEHEGLPELLEHRRRRLFELFLKPVTTDVCTTRKFTHWERDVYIYCWTASQGPQRSPLPGPHNKMINKMARSARTAYALEMNGMLAETAAQYEAQLLPMYQALSSGEYGAYGRDLCALPAHTAAEKGLLTHARFLREPEWALNRDLVAAVSALRTVRVINSAGDLSDLLQQGRHHRLFSGEPQKEFFVDEGSLKFWTSLVALWLIGLHEQNHRCVLVLNSEGYIMGMVVRGWRTLNVYIGRLNFFI